MSLVMKTRGDVAPMAPAIKRAVESIGSSRAVYDIRPMADYTAESVNETRFVMLVLVIFAGASLLLTVAGLYATLAYLVSRRTQEFGIGAVAGVIAIVACVASAVPAMRAARVDPLVALRYE